MIKRIYFENFKSFQETEIQIENITTLIGTNAAGKTNMVEGLMILSEIMAGKDLSIILDGTKNSESSIRGGAKGCCRLESDYFILGCIIKFDENIDLDYKIKIEVKDRVMVSEEKLYEVANAKRKLIYDTKLVSDSSENIIVVCNNLRGGKLDISCIRFSAVISQIVTKLPQEKQYGRKIVGYINAIIDSCKNILFLNPETSQMRGYSSCSDTELKVNASNISSVLNTLCKDLDNKNILLNVMQQLPENKILDITFREGAVHDVILFLEEKVGKTQEKIEAARLSDGTLRCLAVLAAVLNEKEGGIIVIEEIDNGIHPGRAKVLINMISKIVKKRGVDIIITTHNVVLLNALSRENLAGVEIVYRDEDGDGKFIPLIKIEKMPELLAKGKLGDVFADDVILKYIKDETEKKEDYSWLED